MLKNEIMAACLKADISLADLANEIGMSRSALNNKLNGRSEFTIGEAARIARATAMEDPASVFLRPKN